MTESMNQNTSRWSAGLCNLSILLYVLWLLLPAVQTTGRAITGVMTVVLFAIGVLLDGRSWKTDWLGLLGRAVCAGVMPLCLFFFMGRGGGSLLSFLVQRNTSSVAVNTL